MIRTCGMRSMPPSAPSSEHRRPCGTILPGLPDAHAERAASLRPETIAALASSLPDAHAGLTASLPAAAIAALASGLPDARRRLSVGGLEGWLRGLDTLHRMGRGEPLLLAWIEAMPPVARDLGEEILPDIVTACLIFSSRTSGAVLERIIATAPLAARRLGDARMFRAW